MRLAAGRTIPGDWYAGSIPENVAIDDTAAVGTSYSFSRYRSQASCGLRMARGAAVWDGTMLDVGPRGCVILGEFALLSEGARIVCDEKIEIGPYSLVAWGALLMDTHRLSADPAQRRRQLERVALHPERRLEGFTTAQPIRIGRNVWIGFDACVLPGVSIGEGSVVAARSVVTVDVAPYTVVAGNPARAVRMASAANS